MQTRTIAFRTRTTLVGLMAVFLCTPAWTDWHQVSNVPQWGRFSLLTSVDFAGRMWVFGPQRQRDGAVWNSPDGVEWERTLGTSPWPLNGDLAWTRHATAVFDNKIWLVTGFSYSASIGLWSSSDGLNWTQVLASPPWVHNTGGPCVVHDGKLWVIGERSHYNPSPEKGVWCSSDGITWTKTGDGAALGERTEHSALAYDGKIWVLGGYVSGDVRDFVNDVWYTVDGANWVQATEHAAWSPRNGHATIAYAGKMWVIGGGHNDVWYSTDGAAWTPATLAAEWPPRDTHASVVFDDKMWVIGGDAYGCSGVWSSTDGAHWSDEGMRLAPWGKARITTSVKSVAKDGELWVVEGPGTPAEGNTVWRSSDGEHWTQLPGPPPWEQRWRYGFVAYGGKIWILGGKGGPQDESPDCYYLNDVWSSEDGQNWEQTSGAAPWSARASHATAVFDGRMWILGGCAPHCMSDVWHSSDGQNWSQACAAAPWLTAYLDVAVFDNKLWVFGKGPNTTFDGYPRDIWSSSDGQEWVHVSKAPPWEGRQQGRIDPLFAAYAGMLWVGGGRVWFDENYGYTSDTWYSPDGVQWTPATAVPWTARGEQASAVFNNKLWMIGGTGDTGFTHETWFYQSEIVFTAIPEGAWKEEGEGLTLSVGIQGAVGNVTYLWIKDGEALDGQTSSVLTIPSLQLSDQGYYWCIVTDESESKTVYQSPRAYVQVFPAGSLSGTSLPFIALAIVATIVVGALVVRHKRSHAEPPSRSEG